MNAPGITGAQGVTGHLDDRPAGLRSPPIMAASRIPRVCAGSGRVSTAPLPPARAGEP